MGGGGKMTVRVRLLRGQDLPHVNFMRGHADPYCVLRVERTEEEKESCVARNTTKPMWNQALVFHGVCPSDVLAVVCKDKNLLIPDQELGSVRLSIGEAVEHAAMRKQTSTFYPPRQPIQTGAPLSGASLGRTEADVSSLSVDSWSTEEQTDGSYRQGHDQEKTEEHRVHGYGTGSGNGGEIKRFESEGGVGKVDSYSTVGRSYYPQPPRQDSKGIEISFFDMMSRWYYLNTQGKLLIMVEEIEKGEDDVDTRGVKFTKYVNNLFVGRISQDFKEKMEKIPGNAELGKLFRPLRPLKQVIVPDGSLDTFPTYTICMRFVREIFGSKRQPWNRNHWPARMIFEKQNLPVRLMVKTQHAMLYGAMGRSELRHHTGYLGAGPDFLRLLDNGVRDYRSRMYTYVLMEERLFFCETGAQFFEDQRSKHAMHCSAAEKVVYAGEFHFRRTPGDDGTTRTLILDNNSGTYAPDKADLPLLGQVFERNFPGLRIELLDFRSDKLKRYHEELANSKEPV